MMKLYPPSTLLVVASLFSATVVAKSEVPLIPVDKVRADTLELAIKHSATAMYNYTKLTGTEACANICRRKDDNTISLLITSNGSHVGCMPVECSENAERIDSLHSHPEHLLRFRANDADRAFLNLRKNGDSSDAVYLRSNTSKGFSETDYKTGSGYMVDSDGVVWHHSGSKETVVVVNP